STLKSPSYTKSVSWQHYPINKHNIAIDKIACHKRTFQG
ncbi:transposase, partial [Shigella dysenteriae]